MYRIRSPTPGVLDQGLKHEPLQGIKGKPTLVTEMPAQAYKEDYEAEKVNLLLTISSQGSDGFHYNSRLQKRNAPLNFTGPGNAEHQACQTFFWLKG